MSELVGSSFPIPPTFSWRSWQPPWCWILEEKSVTFLFIITISSGDTPWQFSNSNKLVTEKRIITAPSGKPEFSSPFSRTTLFFLHSNPSLYKRRYIKNYFRLNLLLLKRIWKCFERNISIIHNHIDSKQSVRKDKSYNASRLQKSHTHHVQ